MERQKRAVGMVKARAAFTLVELLVVIAIIGMLMALLMPAVSAAREAGRLASCKNNQRQVTLAMLTYESTHKSFPGWRNNVTTTGGGTVVIPWEGMILPNLERNDLWGYIKQGSGYTLNSVRVLVCPSDPPATMTGAGPCAYVANGLILRDAVSTGSNALPPQTLDYVINNDGTAYTLLLSENTQSPPPAASSATPKTHNWYDCDTTSPSSTYQIKQTFGFAITGNVYPSALQTFASVYAVSGTMYSATNPMIANINSGHGGGAVVAFCDNHVIFLRDDAGLNPATNPTNVGSSPTVYQILVSPEGSKNGSEPAADESQWPGPG